MSTDYQYFFLVSRMRQQQQQWNVEIASIKKIKRKQQQQKRDDITKRQGVEIKLSNLKIYACKKIKLNWYYTTIRLVLPVSFFESGV